MAKKRLVCKNKVEMVKGHISKVLYLPDGKSYVVVKTLKKGLRFTEFTCSIHCIEGGTPSPGKNVLAFSVHKISGNRWRAEKVVILKDKRKDERK